MQPPMAENCKMPSPREWSRNRERIEGLYQTMPLKALRAEMAAKHGFHAKERSYRSYFNQWGVTKYTKSDQKIQLICNVVNQALSQADCGLDISDSERQKLIRHIKSMSRRSATSRNMTISEPSESPEPSSQEDMKRSPDDHGSPWSFVGTHIEHSHDRSQVGGNTAHYRQPPDTQLAHRNLSLARTPSPPALTFSSGSNNPRPSLSISPDGSPELRSLRLILANINSYLANTGLSSTPIYSTQESAKPTLWSDIGSGIYLLKVSAPERAWPVLQNAGTHGFAACTEIQLGSMTGVRELLTTLSPVNTAIDPGVRTTILSYLQQLFHSYLGEIHPVTVIATHLASAGGLDPKLSEQALRYILDEFKTSFGETHEQTLDLHRSLIRLLRRGRGYDEALSRAWALLGRCSMSFGTSALTTRQVAREVEHVLMDIEDWEQAKEVCLGIVGRDTPADGSAKPRWDDEWAVLTMEDLAKIMENQGHHQAALRWLERAAEVAWPLWGHSTGLTHIVDKIEALLPRCGRKGEADVWRMCYLNEGNDV